MTAAIVPRWEWRTFAERFGEDVDRRFDALATERVEESGETYLVSPRSDASVKVRAGLVDVKTRVEVSADGLEQWKPVLKAAYPLSASDVGVVLRALDVEGAPLARPEYTREQLVEEVIRPHTELRPVAVHKRRAHYALDGCLAERSEVRGEDWARLTIAVESEDPDRVLAAVRGLGYEARPNVSLPRELRVHAGLA